MFSVYSGTCLPIFIEIRSCLIDTEQHTSWYPFLLKHDVEIDYEMRELAMKIKVARFMDHIVA